MNVCSALLIGCSLERLCRNICLSILRHSICRKYRSLEALRPALRAMVDGEDHDVGFLDGIGSNEWHIRNEQLTCAGNPASSARYRGSSKLLNASDNLQCDPAGNFLAIGNGDVILGLIQLLGRLLGPFDHWRARPVLLSPCTTCSWLTTWPFRISSSPLRTNASW